MGEILVTGASGFIGEALSASLAEIQRVVMMSRRKPPLDLPWIRGDFAAFEDLRQLDDHKIDAVVHLGAVTGGCLERDGMLVNVEGSRCLMRYLIDRGCRKLVLASSIAAVGFQRTDFRPLRIPIPDEHPCFDVHGYGFSKYMMEEVARYHCRQHSGIDVTCLRLSSVADDGALPAPVRVGPPRPWQLGSLTIMARSDAVRAFTMAVESPVRPGLRIMNAVGPKAWAADPVPEILRNWWGDDVDLSYFADPARTHASVFDSSRIKSEIGFEALVHPSAG